MPNKITHTQVYVLDQDEALDFYVGKLGFEVNTDADLGFMRWLTVNFPGQPDQQLLLEKPGPPAHDDATAEQIRELDRRLERIEAAVTGPSSVKDDA